MSALKLQIVTIDGPAGAGKSTIAKRLAKELNLSYLDTGDTDSALEMESLAALAESMLAGEIDTLICLDTNPVYDCPGDVPFVQAMESVDTVVLRLRGDGVEELVRVPVETEPILKEHYEAFMRSPATYNRWISVENLETGGVMSFRPSDIIDVMSGRVTDLGQSLSYRHVTQLPDSELFVVAEREILFKIGAADV